MKKVRAQGKIQVELRMLEVGATWRRSLIVKPYFVFVTRSFPGPLEKTCRFSHTCSHCNVTEHKKHIFDGLLSCVYACLALEEMCAAVPWTFIWVHHRRTVDDRGSTSTARQVFPPIAAQLVPNILGKNFAIYAQIRVGGAS